MPAIQDYELKLPQIPSRLIGPRIAQPRTLAAHLSHPALNAHTCAVAARKMGRMGSHHSATRTLCVPFPFYTNSMWRRQDLLSLAARAGSICDVRVHLPEILHNTSSRAAFAPPADTLWKCISLSSSTIPARPTLPSSHCVCTRAVLFGRTCILRSGDPHQRISHQTPRRFPTHASRRSPRRPTCSSRKSGRAVWHEKTPS